MAAPDGINDWTPAEGSADDWTDLEPKAAPKPSFTDSVARGVDTMQGMLYGAVEATGEAVGSPGVTEFGREGRVRNAQEAAAYGDKSNFTDIGGFGDFTQWAKETIGEQIPLMGPSVVSGLGGAGVGAAVAGPPGAIIGGIIGAFVPSFALGVGETQQNIKDKDPNAVAPGHAFVGGSAIAALDSVLPGKLGGVLIRKFGVQAAEEIAKRALTKTVAPGAWRRGATGAVEGLATEAVTEAIQEAVGEVAAATATGQPMDPALGTRMLEAGAAGGLLGGIMGGAGHALPERTPAPGEAPPPAAPGAEPPAAPSAPAVPAGGMPDVTALAEIEKLAGEPVTSETPVEAADLKAREDLKKIAAGAPPAAPPTAAQPQNTQDAPPVAPPVVSPPPVAGTPAAAPSEPPVAATLHPDVETVISADPDAGTAANPVDVTHPGHIRTAERHVEPEPTDAQKQSGAYAKGHIRLQGLDIAIENPKGGVRSGVGADGAPWTSVLPAAYGYIKRAKGADGDNLDVFIGDHPKSDRAYVIDQKDENGFDEHKAMLGFTSEEEAVAAYKSAFSDGRGGDRIAAVTPMPMDLFKRWVRAGDPMRPLQGQAVTLADILMDIVNGKVAADAVEIADRFRIARIEAAKLLEEISRRPDTPIEIAGGKADSMKEGRDVEKMRWRRIEGSRRDARMQEHALWALGKFGMRRDDFPTDAAFFDAVAARMDAAEREHLRPIMERAEELGLPLEQQEAFDAAAAMADGASMDEAIGDAFERGAIRMSAEVAVEARNDEDVPDEWKTEVTPDPRLAPPAVTKPDASRQAAAGTEPEPTPEGGEVRPGPVDIASATDEPASGPVRGSPAEPDGSQAVEPATTPKTPLEAAYAFAAAFAAGRRFESIVTARKFAADQLGIVITAAGDKKALDEIIEHAVVLRAHKIVDIGRGAADSPQQIFDALVDLYKQQPKLAEKTSGSALRQAYSTPAPIAYLASELAGIDRTKTVYEPTAGNGMLLIDAESSRVVANEIDPARVATLHDMMPDAFITSADAVTHRAPVPVDVVIANPPFGKVLDDAGSTLRFKTDKYTTTEIDHAIALQALKDMKPDGSAVLIIGGKHVMGAERTDDRLRQLYNSELSRAFFKELYGAYNVVDHFTIDGKLYDKQGAAWPIDVIRISGRGKSALPLPGFRPPRTYDSFDDLKGLLNGERGVVTPGEQPGADGGLGPEGGTQDDTVPGAADGKGPRHDPGSRTPRGPRGNTGGGPLGGGISRPRPGDVGPAPGSTPSGDGDVDTGGRDPGPLPDEGGEGRPGGQEDSDGRPPAGDVAGAGDTPGVGPLSDDDFDKFFDAAVEEVYAPKEPAPKGGAPAADPMVDLAKDINNMFDVPDDIVPPAAETAARTDLIEGVDGKKYAVLQPQLAKAAITMGVKPSDTPQSIVLRLVAALQKNYGVAQDKITAMRQYLKQFMKDLAAGIVNLVDKLTPRANTEVETKHQVKYTPRSEAPFAVGTLVPINMQAAITRSLGRLEERVGNIDAYVAKELGFENKQKLWTRPDGQNRFSAEQIDALAMAMNNLDRGAGFIIGDQCVAAGTMIYDPIKNTHTAIEVLAERGKPHVVLSLTPTGFEPRIATRTFKKSVADLYTVTLDDGRKITATRGHRFLTPLGWASMRDGVSVGGVVAAFDAAGSSSVAIRGGDGLRSTKRPQDCLGDYSSDLHPYDGQLPAGAGDDRERAPSPDDVGGHIHSSSHGDDLASSPEHSPRVLADGLLARNSLRLQEIHGRAQNVDRIAASAALRSPPTCPVAPQSHGSQISRPEAGEAVASARSVDGHRSTGAVGLSPSSDGSTPLRLSRHVAAQSAAQFDPSDIRPQFDDDQTPLNGSAGFSSGEHTGWRRIVSIAFAGRADFYDMHVPGDENYVAEGFVNHNTGVGKGRFGAGMMLYAKRKGMTPIFITDSPGLYADMYRDLAGIGAKDFSALMTNNGLTNEKAIPLPDGSTLQSLTPAKQTLAFNEMKRTGKLPAGYDALFTNYSQLQYATGGIRYDRHDVLDALGPNALVIMDESHKAGGTAAKRVDPETGTVLPGRADYARDLLRIAAGAVYASATFAKNPHVMSLYFKTDLAMAVDNIDDLAPLIEEGGVPFMQVISNMLVDAGQYARRERSFDGVGMHMMTTPVNNAHAENASTMLRTIFEFDKTMEDVREAYGDAIAEEGDALGADNATGHAGVTSASFSSMMHNIISQSLLALKANAAADEAIAAWKRGEKPVIALSNTLEGIVQGYVDDNAIKRGGDMMAMTFNRVFQNYLNRTRQVSIKDPHDPRHPRKHYITDAELERLGMSSLIGDFNRITAEVKKMDVGSLPASPIDAIRDRMKAAGMKVGEITGRKLVIDDGALAQRDPSAAAKKNTMTAFQQGQVDALIINSSGSTGFSLHAAPDAWDQELVDDVMKRIKPKQRHMLLLQADPNIDTFQQILGRVHRTGQIIVPKYTLLLSDLPAERRPAANLMRKMAALNANTSANRESALTIKNAVDFINQYGDIVVHEILNEDSETRDILDMRPSPVTIPGYALKATGRIAILPITKQEELYARIESKYNEVIELMNRTGQNALEAKTLDLDAETLNRTEVSEDKGIDSPFAKPAYMEQVSANRLGKPMTLEEVESRTEKLMGAPSGEKTEAVIGALKDSVLVGAETVKEKLRADIEAQRLILEGLRGAEDFQTNLRVQKAVEKVEDKLHSLDEDLQSADSRRDAIVRYIDVNTPGTAVTVTAGAGDAAEDFLGISMGIVKDKGGAGPLAMSSYSLHVAVADGSRELKIPLSRLASGRYSIEPANFEMVSTAFENGQAVGRENRSIVTGNLVAGFAAFQGRGIITMFKDNKGQIRQGILLPRRFDAGQFLDKKPVVLTADQTMTFLDRVAANGGHPFIKTEDGKFSIQAINRGEYGLKVKTRGGKPYYLNRPVIAILGDWTSRQGGKEWGNKAGNRAEALRVLKVYEDNLGTKFHAEQEKEIAREITGKAAPAVQRGGMQQRMNASGAQTDTMQFRWWFGDSKVVDAKGEPLVVYHGTDHDFDKFSPRRRPAGLYLSFGGMPDVGSWFGSTPGVANNFTREQHGIVISKLGETKEGGNVLPVYLSIENPKTYATFGDFEKDAEKYKTGAGMRGALERAGHDGIIIKKSNTDGGGERTDYVAFRPEQIKSAISNNGDFDPSKAKITQQRMAAGDGQSVPTGTKRYKLWDGAWAELTPAKDFTANQRELSDLVNTEAARMFPGARTLGATRLYGTVRGRGDERIHGVYNTIDTPEGVMHILAWSLEGNNPVGTVRHEGVHYLRATGRITDAEWKTLSGTADSMGWIGEHNIDTRYPEATKDRKLEEAVAEQFGKGRKSWSRLPPAVAAIFNKIDIFLRRIAAGARRILGAKATAADIFTMIETGEIGKRAGNDQAKTAPAQSREEPALLPGKDTDAIEAAAKQRAADRERAEQAMKGKKTSVKPQVAPDALPIFGGKGKQESMFDAPDPEEGRGPLGSGPTTARQALQDAASGALNMWQEFQMKAVPMAVGSDDARAVAKDFAVAMRLNLHEFNKVIEWLGKNFKPEQLKRMWDAADEQSVAEQTGASTRDIGLSRLTPDERAATQQLQAVAKAAWRSAVRLGMVQGEGLPSYVPRMLINLANAGNGGATNIDRLGANVRKTTGQMKHRKHLTTEETEEAAREHFGDEAVVVRDIRTLAVAVRDLQNAIAGRILIDKIRRIGAASGDDLVVEGAQPVGTGRRWFTLPHPAFMRRVPAKIDDATGEPVKDSEGNVVTKQVPLYVRGDFEGPLRAILAQDTGAIYNAMMSLKGKAMSAIMYSPLIHNAVEWGRALPAMPGKVLTFKAYFEGNRAKNDPATMRGAIKAGLVPIGQRYGFQDITSIVEDPNIAPGRSWTAKLLGAIPGLFDARAGDAVRRSIDRAGDFWHNTLLWDRVADLQMGLYVGFRDKMVKKGLDVRSAERVAAHLANRYAGALPLESMSTGARKFANFALFSRTFTLGNLGAMKDALTGLPKDVQAQILRDSGELMNKMATSMAQRKAVATVALDIALFYIANAVLQDAIGVLGGDDDLDDVQKGYVRRWHELMQRGRENPLDLLNPFEDILSLMPQSENEPGKRERFRVGHTGEGTAVYGRNPAGKIGEEFIGWLTGPLDMLRRKEGTVARPLMQTVMNTDEFGRKVYDPYAVTPSAWFDNIGRIVTTFMSAQLPMGSITAARDYFAGRGDPATAEAQALGPMVGLTFSKGFPGGEEAALAHFVEERYGFMKKEETPAIRRMIQDGDVAGARKKMDGLGFTSRDQTFIVQATLNPRQHMRGGQNRSFTQHSTPTEKRDLARIREQKSGVAQ